MPDRICRNERGERASTAHWLTLAAIAAALAFVTLLAQGQGTENYTPAVRLVPRSSAATPLVIDAGDLIDVEVFHTPELSGKHRVGSEGSISLPGAGEVKVIGLTPLEAASALEKSLRDAQIMIEPHVSVAVVEYTTEGITVLGEVKTPGTYPLLGAQTLYGALAAAGGVTPREGSTITVNHRSDPSHPRVIEVNSVNYSLDQQSTLVEPGDVVFVSQAGSIYVVGDVTRPGEFLLHNGPPLRALNALALAEGVKDSAALQKASIIRRTDDGAETIPVDLKRVAKNEAPDPVLLPSDILVIPRSGVKTFVNAALPGASSAVLNAVALALIYR